MRTGNPARSGRPDAAAAIAHRSRPARFARCRAAHMAATNPQLLPRENGQPPGRHAVDARYGQPPCCPPRTSGPRWPGCAAIITECSATATAPAFRTWIAPSSSSSRYPPASTRTPHDHTQPEQAMINLATITSRMPTSAYAHPASKRSSTCYSHQSICRVRHYYRWCILTDTLDQAMPVKMIAARRLHYSHCPGHRGSKSSKVLDKGGALFSPRTRHDADLGDRPQPHLPVPGIGRYSRPTPYNYLLYLVPGHLDASRTRPQRIAAEEYPIAISPQGYPASYQHPRYYYQAAGTRQKQQQPAQLELGRRRHGDRSTRDS
jgi:hypothetical protein